VVQLGPEVRAPNGSVRQYGVIPIKGTPLRFSSYMLGGGTIGNVGRNSLVVLKSSLPYVASVTNRQPATGGADLETIEHAKMRAGALFRTLDRAVTATDYEILARQASTAVARARCLGPSAFSGRNVPKPGTVVVLIVPAVPAPQRPLDAEELQPSADLIETVRAYLDDRRLVTTVVSVRPARVIRVSVQAHIGAHPTYQPEQTRSAVERALYQLLNPVVGGPDGSGGWPFGRDLSIYDIHAAIQGVLGVGVIEDVRLSVVDQRGRARDGGVRIPVPADTVIASARHAITVAGRR
jgi:predicted phage baseplate assembly protein